MPKVENHKIEKMVLEGQKITLTSYRIGENYYCQIANADPGATIARSEAKDPVSARKHVLDKAKERLN